MIAVKVKCLQVMPFAGAFDSRRQEECSLITVSSTKRRIKTKVKGGRIPFGHRLCMSSHAGVSGNRHPGDRQTRDGEMERCSPDGTFSQSFLFCLFDGHRNQSTSCRDISGLTPSSHRRSRSTIRTMRPHPPHHHPLRHPLPQDRGSCTSSHR